MRPPERPRFAYSPRSAPGELLSSWLQRTAIEHKVSALDLVQGASHDVDWDPSTQYLTRLSIGSGLPVGRLRAMTLRATFPEGRRDWFAWSERPFAGCHAFCPRCAEEDLVQRGAVIQTMENAGVWRIACNEHRCLLDGVNNPQNVEPWKRGDSGSWARGVIAPTPWPSEAPAFALAFQKTAEAALRGQPPTTAWLIREPETFLRLARQLADLILRTADVNCQRTSGLDLLVGHVWPQAVHYGGDFRAPGWIDRMPAPERVRTLVGVALLMLDPEQWSLTDLGEWFCAKGYQDPKLPWRPWARVTEAWGLAEAREAAVQVSRGPERFRQEAEAGLALRFTHMRLRGWND